MVIRGGHNDLSPSGVVMVCLYFSGFWHGTMKLIHVYSNAIKQGYNSDVLYI
jgi:hypothetical protein